MLTSILFVIKNCLISITKVLLENGWNSKQMITEAEAAIPLETTRAPPVIKRKQKSAIVEGFFFLFWNYFEKLYGIKNLHTCHFWPT